MEQSPQVQEVRSDNKAIRDFTSWFDIKNHNGWLVYENELNGLVDLYSRLMEDVELSADKLKNYQLIRKGLKMALHIPVYLENKAKMAQHKTLGQKAREGLRKIIGR